MKVILEKLTQRLDHMVPDYGKHRRDKKAVDAYLKAIKREERLLARKIK